MKSRSAEKIKLTSIDELLGVVNEESMVKMDMRRYQVIEECTRLLELAWKQFLQLSESCQMMMQ